MTNPLDTVYVDIEPNVEGFERRATVSFDTVAAIGDRVVAAIERAFEQMADVVGEQFGQLRREADQNMAVLVETVDRVGHDIGREINQGTEAAERAFDELRREADRDLDSVERKSASVSASVRGHFGALGASIGVGGIAAAGISAAGAALGALTAFGLKSAASLEQVQVQFNSLLGSAEQGQKVFKDLQQFAAATPFEFPDVAHAAARFLAFDQAVGLSDSQLQDFLTTTGNVISVTGGGAQALDTVSLAMGQIASSGKLTLDNLNQISEALPGFSAVQAIANATGRSTADVMDAISKGEIDATTGIHALLQGMQQFPGAAGAMEAQAQTLLGVFSTFKDTVSQALAGAFTPVIPAIKDSLTQITPILGDALNQVAPALGGVLASLLPLVGQIVQQLAPILTPILGGLSQGLGGLAPLITGVLGALAPLATALQPLLALVGQLAGVLGTALGPVLIQITSGVGQFLVPIFNALSTILTALTPSIIQIGTALGTALAPVFQALAAQAPQLAASLVQLTPSLIQLAQAISQAIIAGMPLINLFVQLIPYMITFTSAGEPILEFLIELTTAIIQLPQTLGDLINSFTSWADNVGTTVSNTVGSIVDWFTNLPGRIWNALQSLPGTLLNVLSDAASQILFAVGFILGSIVREALNFPGQLIDIIKSAWDAAYSFTVNGVTALLNFIGQLPGMLGNIISSAWDFATSLFRRGVDDVSNTAQSLPGRIWNFLSGIPGQIWNIFSNLGNTLYGAGRDAIMGLVNGIGDMLSWAVNAAWNAAKKIADGFFSALGIHSPSKLFAEAGRYSVQGYVMGAEYEAKTTTGPLAGIVNPMITQSTTNTTTMVSGGGGGGFSGTVLVSIGGRQVDAVITDILYGNSQDVAQAAELGQRRLARR